MRTPMLLALAVLASPASLAVRPQPQALPRTATVCDLLTNPPAWNHVRVRVTGLAAREFENFSLSDPACGDTQTPTWIWLTYGGRVSSETIYCCPGEGGQSLRPEALVIEGIALPVIEDEVFRRFRELLRKPPRATARVALQGTFFAGEKNARDNMWGGFGHLGCCSLLVIQRVERFEPAR